ncbi:MAG TPA: hypothetical protein PLW65_27915 [Pseudomonadota bacterium]|nr:hypothetical protein [Pseudomonadota bacterium]
MKSLSVGRWWILAVGLFALLAFWLRPRRPDTAPTPLVREETRDRPPADPPTAPRPLTPPDVAPAPAPAAASAEADPYGMPPPSPDQIRPVPEAPVITPQDHQRTRQAARELVESGIARLTDEGRRAEQAGDVETARRNQLRVARLRKRLEVLQQEAAPAPLPQ